jgi:hypothetical protein
MVFVLADQPVLAKYGQRGGRFGLIEAGAATQNIALRCPAIGWPATCSMAPSTPTSLH